MSTPRSRAVCLLLVVVLAMAGCQMQVAVDVEVNPDGSGVVRAGIGLDDAASGRVGDLDAQVHVDDLRAAGWTVVPATKEPDGLTWVRASKPFDSPDQAGQVLAELTGPDGAFREFSLTVDESLLGTTYELTGTVDLTAGPASFSDAELASALGGDPFGGTLQAIEAEEGRPISEMVDFTVQVSLPGMSTPETVQASFADTEPTEVDVSSTQRSGLASLWIWVVVGLIALVALVLLRQAFRHRHH